MLIDHYEVEIERNATHNEIKKAYYKLAMKYHSEVKILMTQRN
ncbi:MAG: DnaJ domain-containing protein [Wolbachia sp.]